MGGATSKALVQQWLATGMTSPAGLAMVTDDFKWVDPASMAELFGSDEAVVRGLRASPASCTSTWRRTRATWRPSRLRTSTS